MSRARSLLLAGGLIVSLAVPAAARAGVSVRVEGPDDTLVGPVTVPVDGPRIVRGGGECAGATAAGALDRASAGDWGGTWYASIGDWALERIGTRSYSFTDPAFWALFVNERPADVGICGTAAQEGDRLLFAPISSAGDFSVGILRLDGVPERATAGVPFTVTVRRTLVTYASYVPTVTEDVAPGARIALPGGAAVTAGSDGTAPVTLTATGAATLRASAPDAIRSAPAATCVTTGSDGLCGTTKPGSATPPVVQRPAPDTAAARARIAGIAEGRRFSRGRGPRLLRGAVEADPSGLRDVSVRLTRRIPPAKGGRACSTWDARRERFVRAVCGAENGRWFSVGDRAAWSYLLPARLGRGRYVLDVRTTDGAGNTSVSRARSADPSGPRERVVFLVS